MFCRSLFLSRQSKTPLILKRSRNTKQIKLYLASIGAILFFDRRRADDGFFFCSIRARKYQHQYYFFLLRKKDLPIALTNQFPSEFKFNFMRQEFGIGRCSIFFVALISLLIKVYLLSNGNTRNNLNSLRNSRSS